VIGENGEQVGIMATREALRLAQERGYDLVEVSPRSRPPVCKIMDYGKYKYEMNKKARDAKKKQHVFQLKEMRFRPKTEEHDYQFKLRHIRDFLKEGNKVKVFIVFRGREMTHREFGHNILERLERDLNDVGAIPEQAKLEGRHLTLIVVPKPS
jgi:translation initiation factor IF-3